MEIRIHHGPGYRLYYVLSIRSLLLLTGGVKDTQARDVRRAKDLLRERTDHEHRDIR